MMLCRLEPIDRAAGAEPREGRIGAPRLAALFGLVSEDVEDCAYVNTMLSVPSAAPILGRVCGCRSAAKD